MKRIFCLLIVIMATYNFTSNHLKLIRNQPHLLGHMVGKTLLNEIHSGWIKKVWYSDKDKSLQGHRGSYKTTAIAGIGSLLWHLFHPNDRVAIIRKPYTEAAKVVRMVKGFYELDSVRALFYYAHGIVPKLKQSRENSLIFNFKKTNTPEGSLDAYGIGGNYTGTHYDKILLDDFATLKDRVSKAERENTKEAIREIQTNVIDPGKQCMFTGTPWHKDDAWGIVPKPVKFNVYQTGILTPEQIEEKKRKTTSSLFACNFELEHVANENAIFKDPIYEKWDWKLPCWAHFDAKYGGECTNALTIMAKRPDGKIQAMGWVFEEHMKTKIKWVAQQLKKYKVKEIYIEDNADKGYAADLLKAEEIVVNEYHESTNKHIKIVSFLKNYWDDLVWSLDTEPEYMVQITDYIENQKPDDAPDSAASLLRQHFYEGDDYMALYRM